MGAPKLVMEVGGKPLIRHAVDAALGSRADSVIVVTGASANEVRAALADLSVRQVHNDSWQLGLASSVRCGLLEAGDVDAVLLLLADQPDVSAELLDALIERHEAGAEIVASDYGAAIGPPALFDAAHFDALLGLEGDHGARTLLTGQLGAVTKVPFPSGANDIDTPSDLEQHRGRSSLLL